MCMEKSMSKAYLKSFCSWHILDVQEITSESVGSIIAKERAGPQEY